VTPADDTPHAETEDVLLRMYAGPHRRDQSGGQRLGQTAHEKVVVTVYKTSRFDKYLEGAGR
jgi:hypothetical protein